MTYKNYDELLKNMERTVGDGPFKDYLLEERYAILDSDNNVTPASCLKWGAWLEFNPEKRVIAKTILDDMNVSTVFIGLDHKMSSDGPSLWFETMVFCKDLENQWNNYCHRYTTWDEAMKGHQSIVDMIKNKENPPNE